MILDLCEDCGSTSITSRPDGVDNAGRQKYWLQCKECHAEWYDIEEDGLFEEDWMDFLVTDRSEDVL